MSLQVWTGFFIACWMISLSPGAGAVASMSAGVNHGFRRGYWTALGLQLGLALQIAVVAVGVGALLATSQLAFTLIKWFGVLYLAYLAIRQWRAAPLDLGEQVAGERLPPRISALVMRGFLVNVSNPKALIFLLAVLPQFVDPHAPLAAQYLLIGVTMVTVDLIVMAGYTGLAARVLTLLRTPRQQRITNRVFASLFLAAAALLSTVRRAAI